MTFSSSHPWLWFSLYWLPMLVSAVGLGVDLIDCIATDLTRRREYVERKIDTYTPVATIGMALSRLLVVVTPVINIFAALLYSAAAFIPILDACERLLHRGLIPKPKARR